MDRKSIGSFIAVLRKANGMTQRELAEKLNVSDKAVSRWERDECAPDLTLIPVIAELFNVTADELLRGERIQGVKESREKTTGQTLSSVRAILLNSERRFKNQSLISSAIAVTGFICMLTIAYSFYKPVVGFAVCFIFSLSAVIMEIILLNNGEFSLQGVSDEWSETVNITIKKLKKTAGIVIGIDIGFIIVGLPLIVYRSYYFTNSVISWASYWGVLPVYMGLAALISVAVCAVIMRKKRTEVRQLIQNWYSFKGMFVPHIFILPANIQRVGFALVVLLIIAGASPRGDVLPMVLILIAFVAISSTIMFVIKIKESRGRLFALVYGVKNLLYCLGLAIVCKNGYIINFVDSYGTFHYTDSPKYSMDNNGGAWILIISGVAYLAIRYYLNKKDAA